MTELLNKGLEEEVYTGTAAGDVVGMAARITKDLEGFSTEPDERNVEFKTEPQRDYEALLASLMGARCRLRQYLREHGGYTLVPGATLSLAKPGEFFISDPDNPYYRYIRDTYGPIVVTASSHLNVGVDDLATLMRACRVVRCEAAMFLAWSAASPFLNGEVTGFHSTRWRIFPETPPQAPIFADHGEFVSWVEGQIASGVMQNRRHLWNSVRPNGRESPRELDRLELRICDRISCPVSLKAALALLEARVWSVIEDEGIDPLREGTEVDWEVLIHANEAAAAESSLDAKVRDWRSGRTVWIRDQIASTVDELRPVARRHGFSEYLEPILGRLETGSPAQQWLEKIRRGRSVRSVVQEGVEVMASQDVAMMGAECA